jgi:4-amino-4-deoxy-L-arabinose transferase-like glycosyltransferase
MRRDKKLWLVLLLALTLRGAFVLVSGDSPGGALNMDSGSYIVPAHNLVEHGVFSRGEWPTVQWETERTPGYPFFLIPFLRGVTINIAAVQWCQVLLGTLTVGLVYWIAFYLTRNSTVAVIAALGMAIDSVAIAYTPIVLTETLFLLVWTLSLLYLLKGALEESMRERWLVLAGLALGLTSLVRPVSLYYFIFVLPFLFWARPDPPCSKRIRTTVVFFLSALIIPAAWAFRNGQRSGLYTFSSIQGENIYVARAALLEMDMTGTSYPQALAHLDAEFEKSLPDRPLSYFERSAARGRWSTNYLLHHLGPYAHFLAKELVTLLAGNSVKAATWLITKDPYYDPWKAPFYNANSLWTQATIVARTHPVMGAALVFYSAFFLTVYGSALLGFAALWKRRGPVIAALLASPALYIVLITIGAGAQGRYRLPAMPCLFILAGIGIQNVLEKRK